MTDKAMFSSKSGRVKITAFVAAAACMELQGHLDSGAITLMDERTKRVSTAAGAAMRAVGLTLQQQVQEVQHPIDSSFVEVGEWLWWLFESGVLDQKLGGRR